MNKNLIILTGELLTAVAIYYIVNMLVPQNISYTCPFDGAEYQTTLAILISVVYIAGVIYSTMWHIVFDIAENNKLKAYKKEYEKNSITGAEKDSTIAALENKIKTLETALDSVIRKGNK